MENNTQLEHLSNSFPKLTEANQHYVLGLVEGLKHAQEKIITPEDKNKVTSGKTGERHEFK